MDNAEVRNLSLSLFSDAKPVCVELTELVLLPTDELQLEFPDINHGLRTLVTKLQNHRDSHDLDQYVVSTKVADYIFFPITNLLKQPLLQPETTRYILEIIAFLTKHSWQYNLDVLLMDQLLPLVILLSGGASVADAKVSTIVNTDFAFKSAAIRCIASLVKCLPRQYFQEKEKVFLRLSALGDITTIILDVMSSFTSPLNQEDNELAVLALDALESLYFTRVNPEQASFVFPGVVSKLVNFCITVKNIKSITLIKVLKVLNVFITKVFNDVDLKTNISDTSVKSSNLSDLRDLFEHQQSSTGTTTQTIKISLPAQTDETHRTESWLRATSKQLKLSMITLFRNVFFMPSSRDQLIAKPQLQVAIFDFVQDIVNKCFKSLFNELLQSSLDILSALIFVASNRSDENDLFEKATSIYERLSYSNINLFFKKLQFKTEDLVYNQLPTVLTSLNEEKINICTVALRLHMRVLRSLISILNGDTSIVNNLDQKILESVATTIVENVSRGHTKKHSAKKDDLLRMLSGQSMENEEKNALDEIELPSYINAKKLTKINKNSNVLTSTQGLNLGNIDLDLTGVNADNEVLLFNTFLSLKSQYEIKALIADISRSNSKKIEFFLSSLMALDSTLHNETNALLSGSIPLWVANKLYREVESFSDEEEFDIDSFLQFEDESNDNDQILDIGIELPYILLERAQTLMTDAKREISEKPLEVGSKAYNACDMALSVSLETIGSLSRCLSKSDFQTDVLMDWLFPILEALTYPKGSAAHAQAKITVNQIVQQFYDGSLEKLIADNSDYLIDSLSLSLSVASGLTPALPGILLIVLKISGKVLLENNQLQDILSEMFIVIDSYHGYSVLVENFFYVFEEIIRKINGLYLDGVRKAIDFKKEPAYKPWGLTDKDAMLELIDDAHKEVAPFDDYDPEKEYFKRKPGIPFSDQVSSDDEGDSDDEDETDVDDESPKKEDIEIWPSPIPKGIYSSVQQIFVYGLQLLSHPSTKLKIQILKTLKEAYLLMASNYTVLMPILAEHWPILLLIMAGTNTLTDHDISDELIRHHQLVEPVLELAIVIFEEDPKHQSFMSRRFTEMWEYLKKKSPLFRTCDGRGLKSNSNLITRSRVPPRVSRLIVKLLITGLNTYERIIPDMVAYDIAKACVSLGIDKEQKLGRDAQNLVWVAKNQG